jgi:hypothetical protein
MSALPPKADMCGATTDVRFGPEADIPFFGPRIGNVELFQPGLTHAFKKFRHCGGGIGDILLDPRDGDAGLDLL